MAIVKLFSRLQVRYRSDRFQHIGKRFGSVGHNGSNNGHNNRDLGRMHKVDEDRHREYQDALENAVK